MNKLSTFAGLAALFFSQFAAANTLILPSLSEPSLIGVGGILDNEFGLGNLQRINDGLDQYWNVSASDVTVTAIAKYAGFSQNFGFIDSDGNFTSLLNVPSMGPLTNTFNIADSGSPFRFGLDPSGSPLFSSDASDNAVCVLLTCTPGIDHMVSWLITDGQYAGDYVVAWEDLILLGDRDYNDMVVHVSGVSTVPVPAAFWLFATGLAGLFAASHRRR